MKLHGRRGLTRAYKSMTQDIAECNTDIDRFPSEYYAVVLSFSKNASLFLTMQIVSVVRPSIHQHQETAQARAKAGVST